MKLRRRKLRVILMPSWVKNDYKGRGYILVKGKDGITELEQIPCSRSCEVQEIKEYGRKLFEHYGNKYQWVKIYDRDMRLLEVLK